LKIVLLKVWMVCYVSIMLITTLNVPMLKDLFLLPLNWGYQKNILKGMEKKDI